MDGFDYAQHQRAAEERARVRRLESAQQAWTAVEQADMTREELLTAMQLLAGAHPAGVILAVRYCHKDRKAAARRAARPAGTTATAPAVLAIVERDQEAAAERGWDALRQCPSESPAIPVPPAGEIVLHCEREANHEGAHGAMRYLTSWRDHEQGTPASGSKPSGGEA